MQWMLPPPSRISRAGTPTVSLVQAPRDEPAVLVADLDRDQRDDWLELFPLLATRRPEPYGRLAARSAEVTGGQPPP